MCTLILSNLTSLRANKIKPYSVCFRVRHVSSFATVILLCSTPISMTFACTCVTALQIKIQNSSSTLACKALHLEGTKTSVSEQISMIPY